MGGRRNNGRVCREARLRRLGPQGRPEVPDRADELLPGLQAWAVRTETGRDDPAAQHTMTTPLTEQELVRLKAQLLNSTWIDSGLGIRALEELVRLREESGLLRRAQAHHVQQIEALKHRLGLKEAEHG